MPALLAKLGGPRRETQLTDSAKDSPLAVGATRREIRSGCPPGTGPCPACGSVLAWLDIYGGGPHCHLCRPWPTERFIRRLFGYDAVAARWRTFWPLGGSQEQAASDRDSCGHPHTRKRFVWPIAEDRSRIAIDFDRVAEVEVFLECLTCGEWIRESEP